MNIDIATTVKVILLILGIAAVISLTMAFRMIKAGHKLQFYRKRQDLVYHGWRLILLAFGIALSGFLLVKVGEPTIYKYFPPSPTITQTPTITMTPTVTLTPSQTFTPTITMTLAQTYTPSLPEMVQATIQTPVGVDNAAVFSVITFSKQTKDGVVINVESNFDQPVTTLYGGFSFDKVATGVQWTAIWLYGTEIVCAETKVWNYAPGGYGYTDCKRPAEAWTPGEYEVQIFIGSTWKSSGRFSIKTGDSGVTPNPLSPGTPTPPPS